MEIERGRERESKRIEERRIEGETRIHGERWGERKRE